MENFLILLKLLTFGDVNFYSSINHYSIKDNDFCILAGDEYIPCNMEINSLLGLTDSLRKDVRGVEIFNFLSSVRLDTPITLCITTNGDVDKNGNAVMGAGIAKQIKQLCPGIEKCLGHFLRQYGNRVFNLGHFQFENGTNINIVSFPTKHHWKENSDLTLISKSFVELKELADKYNYQNIFLPCPGVGNGKLPYSVIENILDLECDHRFFVFMPYQA